MAKAVGLALGAALLPAGPSPAEAHKVIVFDDAYDTMTCMTRVVRCRSRPR